MVWGAAVFAVGAIGWIPGLSPVSRGLLALVLVVIVLQNYQNIIEGLSQPLQRPGETVGGDVGSMFPGIEGIGEGIGSDVGSLFGNLGSIMGSGNFAGGFPDANSNPWILH